jgi:hypothetical protein
MFRTRLKRCGGSPWHLFEKINKAEIENNSINPLTNARR